MTDTGWFAALLAYGIATELFVGQPRPVLEPIVISFPTEIDIPSVVVGSPTILKDDFTIKGADAMIPAGMLALFMTACPAGWAGAAPPNMMNYVAPPAGSLYATQLPQTLYPLDGRVWCTSTGQPAK